MPLNSRVPDPSSGDAQPSDYDAYFGLDRGRVDLREWTSDCLALERELRRDLPDTDLNDAERNQILSGLVVLYRSTLEQWARAPSLNPNR
jgi:hypothetical protein